MFKPDYGLWNFNDMQSQLKLLIFEIFNLCMSSVTNTVDPAVIISSIQGHTFVREVVVVHHAYWREFALRYE